MPAASIARSLRAPRARELVGRAEDLGDLKHLFTDPEATITTVCGPGGVGKSMLAEVVAAEFAATFRDGALFLPLSRISDPKQVLPEIANALDISGSHAVESPPEFWANMDGLLALDNLEQVTEAPSERRRIFSVGFRARLRRIKAYNKHHAETR